MEFVDLAVTSHKSQEEAARSCKKPQEAARSRSFALFADFLQPKQHICSLVRLFNLKITPTTCMYVHNMDILRNEFSVSFGSTYHCYNTSTVINTIHQWYSYFSRERETADCRPQAFTVQEFKTPPLFDSTN